MVTTPAPDITLEGLHPTSIACLEALAGLEAAPVRVLDIGCGGGLLGGFSALRWPQAQVLAADISTQAVADTQALIDAQQLEGRMRVVRADMLSHDAIRQDAPYNLIICNLLAEPIVRAAEGIRALAAPGAVCVLSGMLAWLAPQVEQAYGMQGFTVKSRVVYEPWHTVVMAL